MAKYNPEADKRWREKKKDHSNYIRNRSASRSFIRNRATVEDLDELIGLIEERRKVLEEESPTK